MVKATMDIRLKAVVLYDEHVKTANEISQLYNISDRTLRRWHREYKKGGVERLKPKKTTPKRIRNKMPKRLVERIVSLKRKYPAWGARRLKHQFEIPLHWTAVHDVLKDNGLLFRIEAKPQPGKSFRRRHVDSMWQGDTFQFRIHDVGKVYVTGFTDDCSRYRVRSKAYLRKGAEEAINAFHWAIKAGRIPRQIYLDNGKQFIAKDFKEVVQKRHIKLIYGKPHNPKGRGKIEAYHKALYRELISQKQFKSLSHFRRELWKFDKKWNFWRRQSALEWQTPAAIYHNKKYFNKHIHKHKKRTDVRLTKADRC